jgi:hypothetical protein
VENQHDPTDKFGCQNGCGESTVKDQAIIGFHDCNLREASIEFTRPSAEHNQRLEESPTIKTDHQPSESQLSYPNWILLNWYDQRDCVMSDETDVDTRVQTMAFLHFNRDFRGNVNLPGKSLFSIFIIVTLLS